MAVLPTRSLALALGLGLAFASSAAAAQVVSFDARTGDVWVDTRLGEINDYGRRHRDPFVDEMHTYYGAPRPLLLDLLDHRGWAPGDVYYACAMARALRLPCADVVREYDRSPGQGWGAVAQRMGIKPGSDAFHALKRGQVETYGRWGQTVVIDRPVRIDWSRQGPGRGDARPDDRGRPSGKPAPQGRGIAAGRGDSGNGPGKGQGPGKGNGPGHGQGAGNGKGNGRGNGNARGNGNGRD